jgi:hypothetical protein
MSPKLPALLVTALCAAACAEPAAAPPPPASDQRRVETQIDATREDVNELLRQLAALRRDSERLHDDIRSLRAEVAGLRIESMGPAGAGDSPAGAVPPMVRINIHTQPGEAEVFLGGVKIGNTPLSLAEPTGNELVLEIRKPGFRPQHHTLRARADTTLSVQLAPE